MYCSNCGTLLPAEDCTFCPECGTRLNLSQPNQNFTPPSPAPYSGYSAENACFNIDSQKFSRVFISQDEQLIAVLGNSVSQQFLSTGILGNGFAFLSNKRMYFKGKCLIRKGKRFNARREDRTVNIKDITGSGFVYQNPIWLMILAAIMTLGGLIGTILSLPEVIDGKDHWLPLLIPSIVVPLILWLCYFAYRWTVFEVAFAGGSIAFSVSWFPMEEAQAFHTALLKQSDEINQQRKYTE